LYACIKIKTHTISRFIRQFLVVKQHSSRAEKSQYAYMDSSVVVATQKALRLADTQGAHFQAWAEEEDRRTAKERKEQDLKKGVKRSRDDSDDDRPSKNKKKPLGKPSGGKPGGKSPTGKPSSSSKSGGKSPTGKPSSSSKSGGKPSSSKGSQSFKRK
jgi:hypothetical protein